MLLRALYPCLQVSASVRLGNLDNEKVVSDHRVSKVELKHSGDVKAGLL